MAYGCAGDKPAPTKVEDVMGLEREELKTELQVRGVSFEFTGAAVASDLNVSACFSRGRKGSTWILPSAPSALR